MVQTFFVFSEFNPPVADGPLACFAGVRSGDSPLKNGGAGPTGGGFNGDVGGVTGGAVVLNGFPSFLNSNYQILVKQVRKLTSITTWNAVSSSVDNNIMQN